MAGLLTHCPVPRVPQNPPSKFGLQVMLPGNGWVVVLYSYVRAPAQAYSKLDAWPGQLGVGYAVVCQPTVSGMPAGALQNEVVPLHVHVPVMQHAPVPLPKLQAPLEGWADPVEQVVESVPLLQAYVPGLHAPALHG